MANKLGEFIKSLSEGELNKFAQQVKASPYYLYQLGLGHYTCGPKLAKRIEGETGGLVGLSDLRPDLWPPV